MSLRAKFDDGWPTRRNKTQLVLVTVATTAVARVSADYAARLTSVIGHPAAVADGYVS